MCNNTVGYFVFSLGWMLGWMISEIGYHRSMPRELLLKHSRYNRVGVPFVSLTEKGIDLLGKTSGKLLDDDGLEVPCICGENQDIGITRVDRHGLPYPLFLCEACGLIRMNPQPNEADLVWYYSELYRPLYTQTEDIAGLFESKLWKGDLVADVLHQCDVFRDFPFVLDVGCGGGWTLKRFHENGSNCVGYDYSEDLIQFGRNQGLDLRVGGLDEALESDILADLVIFSHVLEHVRNPENEIRKLKRLLKDGGLLYIETPSIYRIKKRLYGDSLLYWQRAHLWEFQLEHVVYFVKKCGLSVVYHHDDGDSCYVICKNEDSGGEIELPFLGDRVIRLILDFERQRSSLKTMVSKRCGKLRSVIGNLLRR